MKIHSISQVILSLLAAIILIMGYFLFNSDDPNPNLLLIPFIIGVAIYFMRKDMDFWWQERNPIDLHPSVINHLEKRNSFYQSLNPKDKDKFRKRLSLYVEGRMFKGVGKEQRNAPEDIKVIISCHAVEMMMAQEDYLIGDWDRVFLYNHPFGSPDKQFLHTVETQAEDGVIIMTTPYILNAVNHPEKYYNIAYHAYAEAIIKQYPTWDFDTLDKLNWEDIEEVSGFKKDHLLKTMGYEQMDLLPVIITHYFSHKEKFREVLSEAAGVLDGYFLVVN
jgi:hypothetical protein